MEATIKREFPYVKGKTYFVMGARNAWDQVPIGLFSSYEDAMMHLPIMATGKCIRVATEAEICTFFGLK